MLFLLFQLGSDRYALEAGRVVEVLPLVELKGLPQAPPGVVGVFNYRGQAIPAVDLCILALQRPARECLSTRIIVVRCCGADGQDHLLGVIAEQATQMTRRNIEDFVQAGLKLERAPYLGPVATDADGMIQWIHEDKLLPDTVRKALFAQVKAAGHAHP